MVIPEMKDIIMEKVNICTIQYIKTWIKEKISKFQNRSEKYT